MSTHRAWPPLVFVVCSVLLPGAAAGRREAPASTPAIAPCPADASAMDGWDTRAPPRRIFGNTWYVGTCGLTVLLVTSPEGHVLIDGGTEAAPPLVEANIRALGFDPRDVKLILASHAHFDHVGGLAALQRLTGATVRVRAPALSALRTGKGNRQDPQFKESHGFAPIPTAHVVADGETLRVGPLALKAHATPGHTPGGTSWTWRSCEGKRCVDIAYADSLSAISDAGYRFGEHPDYLAAFRASFDTVAALPCDVLVTPHPVVSKLFARLDGAEGASVVESGACARYAAQAREGLSARLGAETPASR